MSLISFSSKILEELYRYDSVRAAKDFIRPIKHFVFGKRDIYYVLDEIKKARGKENPVRIVFDVGAAFGDKTLTFLKYFPQAQVFCFEPQKESALRLKKRTIQYANRVKLFEVGLFNRSQDLTLHKTSYPDASSILSLEPYLKGQGLSEIGQEKIHVIALDDFMEKEGIGYIDFIKIDVEGVEKEVLEGGRQALLNKIDNVFIEISPLRKGPHSRDYITVFQLLYDSGFTLIGYYGDYFFSKDQDLLKRYFNRKA